jgi:deoxyribodipyrimidine photo-lyase
VDFEPGIHYSQVQMQSGVTGINSIRIYSPKKQALDQDPQGDFIKRYVPELSLVPVSDLAEPHLMPPLLQIETGYRPGITYPNPIVDPEESYQSAKDRIFTWKKSPDVQKTSQSVLKKHASRKNIHFPTQKRDAEKA